MCISHFLLYRLATGLSYHYSQLSADMTVCEETLLSSGDNKTNHLNLPLLLHGFFSTTKWVLVLFSCSTASFSVWFRKSSFFDKHFKAAPSYWGELALCCWFHCLFLNPWHYLQPLFVVKPLLFPGACFKCWPKPFCCFK